MKSVFGYFSVLFSQQECNDNMKRKALGMVNQRVYKWKNMKKKDVFLIQGYR